MPRGAILRRCDALGDGVDSDAALATRDAQQSAIMHQLEQMGRRVRRAAPVIGDGAVREMGVDLTRVNRAALLHEGEQRLCPAMAPRLRFAGARVHQHLHRARQEAVVDEDVLFDPERGVAPLEITGAVAADAMPERQILRAGRRADRVGLHERQIVDRAAESRRREETAGDRETPEVVECEAAPHRPMIQVWRRQFKVQSSKFKVQSSKSKRSSKFKWHGSSSELITPTLNWNFEL